MKLSAGESITFSAKLTVKTQNLLVHYIQRQLFNCDVLETILEIQFFMVKLCSSFQFGLRCHNTRQRLTETSSFSQEFSFLLHLTLRLAAGFTFKAILPHPSTESISSLTILKKKEQNASLINISSAGI